MSEPVFNWSGAAIPQFWLNLRQMPVTHHDVYPLKKYESPRLELRGSGGVPYEVACSDPKEGVKSFV